MYYQVLLLKRVLEPIRLRNRVSLSEIQCSFMLEAIGSLTEKKLRMFAHLLQADLVNLLFKEHLVVKEL